MKYGKFPKVGEIWRHVPWSDGHYQKDGWLKVAGVNLPNHPKYDGGRPGLVLLHGGEKSWKDKTEWFYPCVSYQYFVDDMHARFLEREDVVKRRKRFVWPLESGDHIHEWFELTYAQYLTIPRSILQSMPASWQKKFVQLLEELDETYDWRPQKGTYRVQLYDIVQNTDGENEWGSPQDDPLMDYERGRRNIPKEIPLRHLKTCDSCCGLKKHHSDHALNGFEKCTRCGGTGQMLEK